MSRHAPFAPRRGGARATTWWGRAWLRSVEESAYGEGDLRAGRRLARAGVVGGILVEPGRLVASLAVPEGGSVTASVVLPILAAAERDALVEVVGAEAGRIAALLSGDLPEGLADHLEEAGVELIPSSFASSCTCDAWVQPCGHAIALLTQVAWLSEADPLVLLALHGVPREELLAQLADRVGPADRAGDAGGQVTAEPDLDAAEDAARFAAYLLSRVDPDQER
ncbi:hypothetical protein [Nocardioides cavernaquae]|uniref:SWIM-type domain-containing protein n=1 Tax=Nocardioides cavernaquae TaxID=2321396 RepID=A0A3A5H5L9_9ACTN|nr:hypothetical protein [Nocardioides cavernaquae]RJS45852.1 hypothetical protein D4739_06175 [Nocardioides cavernaquae]